MTVWLYSKNGQNQKPLKLMLIRPHGTQTVESNFIFFYFIIH